MKLNEAMKLIENKQEGFIIDFEIDEGSVFRCDHFPDIRDGENPIQTYNEALELAEKFSHVDEMIIVNLGVARVKKSDCTPSGYKFYPTEILFNKRQNQ